MDRETTPNSVDGAPPTQVLVVDDSAAQRTLMARALSSAGYRVVTASDPEAALDLACDPTIRIVVSDWSMPGMDGPEFCARFRHLRGEDHAYFVLVTSDGDRDTKVKGLDSGADDFVTRPIDWIELRARLRAGERMLAVQDVLRRRTCQARTALGELRRIHEAIQRAFLPPETLRYDGAELALRLVTHGKVGGDLVGHFPISDHEVAIYSIDVSGHGIASALVTGRLASLLSSRTDQQNVAFTTWPTGVSMASTPDRVMHKLNDIMIEELRGEIYFTALMAYVNLRDGRVRLCQAGHPHPFVRRADGRVERLGEGGPPIGLLDGPAFEMCETTLGPGDLLMAYSDGLIEAEDPAGAQFGEEGVVRTLSSCKAEEGAEILGEMERALGRHAGGREFEDDLSMILFRFDRGTRGARPGARLARAVPTAPDAAAGGLPGESCRSSTPAPALK
jgi:sigma-B regulation protein RsbU (phosphoserine phosphatase)